MRLDVNSMCSHELSHCPQRDTRCLTFPTLFALICYELGYVILNVLLMFRFVAEIIT